MSRPSGHNTQELPKSVRQLLDAVRLRLRWNAMLSGIILSLTALALVFWGTTGLDQGWFALQKLELPVGLRTLLLIGILPAVSWLLLMRVIQPLLRRIRDLDLALLVERRHPEFQDRLITAVEATAISRDTSPLTERMLRRTTSEAGELALRVAPGEMFSLETLKRRGVVAGTLMASIVALAVVQPESLSRWWNAFVLCRDSYHQRVTDLQISVVAQPGDRHVSFLETADGPIYRHARGADLELEMVVPATRRPDGREWVVPERIRVDVIRPDGSRSRADVSAVSARTFRYVVTRLQQDLRIEILAGDFRTREAYRVQVVSPPGIDTIDLECRYPEYTGWNRLRTSHVSVTGSEVALPMGTRCTLHAASNKSLQSARIVSDLFEIEGDPTTSRIIPRGTAAAAGQTGPPLITSDGRGLNLTLLIVAAAMTRDAAQPDATTPDGGSGKRSTAEPPADAGSATASPVADDGTLSMLSNTTLRFFLHDTDDVISVNPESLRIRGVEDAAPAIVMSLSGIGNAVTRRAHIPIKGTVRDDYGIAAARFEFRVDDESNWRPRPFRQSPGTGATEFTLGRSDQEPFELFEAQPLELSEGQTITLTIAAADLNDLSGPGLARSEPVVFRIVSDEELLSLLYSREINLRRRFEETIEVLEQIRDDLQFHLDLARRSENGTGVAGTDDRIGISTCATRSANGVRRQTNELTSIADGFDEIVLQLINNEIPPAQLAENMRQQIVSPLRNVTGPRMEAVDRGVSRFRVASLDGSPTAALIEESHGTLSEVITELKLILESVRDLAEFHEALRDLRALLEEQQRVRDETKQLQKQNLIDKLKLLEE